MDASQGLSFVLYAIVAFFASGTILSGFFQFRAAEAVVIQRMGKFLRVATAGINFKLPWLDQIAGRIDLRVQQLALDVETKTKDNVFVKIPVSVQYHVIPEKVYAAFYKLANPKQQISSYVFNVILGHVPKMNLDDACASHTVSRHHQGDRHSGQEQHALHVPLACCHGGPLPPIAGRGDDRTE